MSAPVLLIVFATCRFGWAQTITTADGLSLTLTSDAQVSAVRVAGDNLTQTPAAALRLRDLSLAGSTFSPNLVVNPGFEIDTDLDGMPDNWAVMLIQNATLTLTTAEQVEGAQSVVADTTTAADGGIALASDPVAVSPGVIYRISAQMKARDGYLATRRTSLGWQQEAYAQPTQISGLHIQWLDGSGTAIGSPTLVVPMHTNARQWKRITSEVVAPRDAATAQIIVGAKLRNAQQEADALWIDDVSMIIAPEADADLVGTVALAGSDLLLTGTVPGSGLNVEVVYRAFSDHLEISGQVTDTTGTDRSLDLAVRLPASLIGYSWWDDMRDSRVIALSEEYSNTISGDVGGFLPISLYPLAAVNDQTHALSLVLPMDIPQVALLHYAEGALEARFKLGISPAATKLGDTATFKVYVATFTAEWGFRAALAKLASIAPEWVNSTRDAYAFKGFEQGDYTKPTQALLALQHDQEGIASGQYTAPEGPLPVADFSDPPPGYDTIITYIQGAQSDPRLMALANSMVIDGNGDFFLKLMAVPNWDPTHWVSIWVLDMDPEITGGYASWIRDYKVDAAFARTSQYGAQLDAIEFDNFMSAPAIDLDATHLALADFSLTYDPNTYRPGLHTQAATHEFLSWLADHIEFNYGSSPGFSANVWGIGTVNSLAPFLDALFNEGNPGRDGSWKYDTLNYRRVIAYHKPVGFSNQEPNVTVADATRFANRALFYGIAGGPGNHGIGWETRAQEVIDQASLWLNRYWQLGWEPVTHAATNTAQVWVERFGSDPDAGLYFTLHNSGAATQPYILTIDTQALGLPSPPDLVARDIRSGATLPYTTDGSSLALSASLTPEDTGIIRLMGTGCAPLTVTKASISQREGANNDKATLRGEFVAPNGSPNFLGEAVSITLSDREGNIYTTSIPAGNFVANSRSTRFKFKDPSGTAANGLVYASFKQRATGTYKWKARIKKVDLTGVNWQYIDSRLTLGTDCLVDTTDCDLRAGGKKLICRPPR